MDKFIIAYPGVVTSVFVILISLVGFLLCYPLYSLSASIDQLRKSMEAIVKELKEDRKKDRTDIEVLQSKMSVIETTVSMHHHQRSDD